MSFGLLIRMCCRYVATFTSNTRTTRNTRNLFFFRKIETGLASGGSIRGFPRTSTTSRFNFDLRTSNFVLGQIRGFLFSPFELAFSRYFAAIFSSIPAGISARHWSRAESISPLNENSFGENWRCGRMPSRIDSMYRSVWRPAVSMRAAYSALVAAVGNSSLSSVRYPNCGTRKLLKSCASFPTTAFNDSIFSSRRRSCGLPGILRGDARRGSASSSGPP